MNSVYFFQLDKKTEYKRDSLPEGIRDHCKKQESIAAAQALADMGVVNLHYDENGKPLADNCYVSISHSGNMVAVCTGESPVGIDIEQIDRQRDTEKIARRFFCGKELDFVLGAPAERFYEIWTKKEAYSKIGGKGVVEIAAKFDVLSLEGYEFETEIVGDYAISVCEKIR